MVIAHPGGRGFSRAKIDSPIEASAFCTIQSRLQEAAGRGTEATRAHVEHTRARVPALDRVADRVGRAVVLGAGAAVLERVTPAELRVFVAVGRSYWVQRSMTKLSEPYSTNVASHQRTNSVNEKMPPVIASKIFSNAAIYPSRPSRCFSSRW